MAPLSGEIRDLAKRWLDFDQDTKTRKQISELLQKDDTESLEKLLRNPIQFGTAGLRARMEAGFARMNCVTVIQASQGLASYVEKIVPNAKERGVVIGHDHRHNSHKFFRLSAAAFLSRGFKVHYFENDVPTPLTAFAVKELKASCGIMVTASHNPKDDNGYKVYWENGAQIIPPHDSGIAECIASQENQVPQVWDEELVLNNALANDVTDEMWTKYVESTTKIRRDVSNGESGTPLKYVYTAMHGVGTKLVTSVIEAMGLPMFIPVSSQISPDPNFPTVAFPNPEEKGALNEATRVAEEVGANLIVANDPDADRFAAAERQEDGSWFTFTGDQLGSIFGSFVLRDLKERGIPANKIAMVNSTVSSRMLEEMARVEGVKYAETLTGFKWMANKLVEFENEGYQIGFGYEEAIGYMILDTVLDKDGVTALGYFIQNAQELQKNGKTIKQYLDELYDKYGYFVSNNSYFTCSDPELTNKIFSRIRFGSSDAKSSEHIQIYRKSDDVLLKYPKVIGGFDVTHIRDLTVGVEFEVDELKSQKISSKGADVYEYNDEYFTPNLMTSASSHMITFKTNNGAIFTLRTSGTEPKIKYYLEIAGKPQQSREDVKTNLDKLVKAIRDEVVEADINGLN
ncbi:hypothetical protein H4219_001898 [Mycoemilia scoparia]|uniref:Phosphoglucomutase n=1 Tax=Mycoemilia scoparia TaxID=417184 RepID=A0A9W8DV44_9FUNG|nr:hypothetical protein H4219_001898 [Mycoemilia scoparia]